MSALFLFTCEETIVEPNQQKSNWYHQRFRRVPTIDECYTDDAVCRFEADQQFRRDRMVDNEILNILRQRFEDCTLYEAPDHMVKCKPLMDQYQQAAENWFIKCRNHITLRELKSESLIFAHILSISLQMAIWAAMPMPRPL